VFKKTFQFYLCFEVDEKQMKKLISNMFKNKFFLFVLKVV